MVACAGAASRRRAQRIGRRMGERIAEGGAGRAVGGERLDRGVWNGFTWKSLGYDDVGIVRDMAESELHPCEQRCSASSPRRRSAAERAEVRGRISIRRGTR